MELSDADMYHGLLSHAEMLAQTLRAINLLLAQ